jgi:uracil-DNA glycosylase
VAVLKSLIEEAKACRACDSVLPLGARPVFLVGAKARLMIVGQAPGRRVHETGIPWNDPSGDLLREWLQLDRDAFYDTSRISILPAGLCYPGTGPNGDAPPRPECAPRWHPRFRAALPRVKLTLLIGAYAQAYYLKNLKKKTLAATVQAWEEYFPEFFPLPHPSPRNRRWLKINPWFGETVIPELRRRVKPYL